MQSWRRTFITIWSGQSISILTSSVLQMAIVWYITQRTGSAALLSLATLIGFLPQALLGLFIGVYIDRYNRKTVMILSDIFIALAGMVLVVAGLLGEIPLWLIYVVLFFRSIGAAFHTPALQAVTPSIVPKDQLTQYAGFAQGFKSLSMVISPALAALLFSIWELHVIILLDVMGVVLAVGILSLVKIPNTAREKPCCRSQVFQEAKEGFWALRREPGLLELLVISCLYAFIYFPIGTLYPLITMTWFGGGVAESGIVYRNACWLLFIRNHWRKGQANKSHSSFDWHLWNLCPDYRPAACYGASDFYRSVPYHGDGKPFLSRGANGYLPNSY